VCYGVCDSSGRSVLLDVEPDSGVISGQARRNLLRTRTILYHLSLKTMLAVFPAAEVKKEKTVSHCDS